MRTLPRAVCLVLAAALSLVVVPASPAAAAPGIDPATVDLTLGSGESQTIAATVTTPPTAPRPDIVLLADTTGSMQPVLANVSQNIRRIVGEVKAAQPEAQFAVAEYKEQRNTRAFHVNTPLTSDENAVANGVDDWLLNVGGGGAPWTDFINAHYRIGTDAFAFRPNTTRIVAWFGDARSHDPSMGHTQQDAIQALQAQGIRVVAVPLTDGAGGGLDALGQASALTAATRGELLPPTAANAVAQGLLDGIRALDVIVAPTVTSCDPALTVGFSPSTSTVPSGANAVFQQTIGVRADAAPGTYGCAVDYRINGVSTGYTQSITVDVPGQSTNLRIGDVSVPEGDSGVSSATFAVTLDEASPEPVTVRFSTADGTATAPGDFVATSGEVIFAPGAVSQQIVVPVVGDTAVEPDETFTVNVSEAVGATIADGQGVGTIVDDDREGSPAGLSIGDVSVPEGDSGTTSATFAVTLDEASPEPVTVRFTTSDGTATAPSDFVATSGEVTFAPGAISQQIVVPVVGDTAVEPDETFTVNLSAATGATIADGQGVGTIVDDDRELQPALSVGDVSVDEGDTGTTAATFAVRLDRVATGPVSVGYETADGSAVAPGDYTDSAGQVTIPAGSTSATFNVPVVGDTAVEPDETFTVNLSAATGATIADGQGVGTIVNDDVEIPPALSVGDASTAEGGAATFTVSLDRPASGPATVRYATANGTAAAPGDFVAGSGVVTFAAGETTKQIAVSTVQDAVDELDETFTLQLSSPEGATIQDGQGTGTIRDDDRNGVFGCRANVLSLTANAPFTPCVNDARQSAGLNVNLGLLRIQAATPRVTTQAADGEAQATAQVGTTKLSTIGLTIELGAVNATASTSCAGATPTHRGSSSIGALKVNGIAIPVGSQPVTVPLLLGTLKLNSTTTTATGVTQRAVDLQTLLGSVVLGEARAGVAGTTAHPQGNPCVQ
ncbi:choice-of-anchor P family protein [Tenggerimyces flavus]|uniref:Choice-of-anchor P family protein n=1 Tax=Tenggerimyces flavus TaxID=1708749 RepID=A0ABV7YHW0_9ACTN|nr:choice-of-anchor P family protein [Tenggerimyces flavus]MBM7789208.1 hypothetical protein [Tenggerimyces flavus]